MWLGVYFPALLIPKEVSVPLVVYHAPQNQVIQCNLAASKFGIEIGMGLASASALCAQLEVLTYSSEKERLRLTHILYQLYKLNGDICLESSCELLIRCDRHDYYYGSKQIHLRVLLDALNKHNTSFYYATANTPEQACVLAKARVNRLFSKEQVLTALYDLNITQLQLSLKTQQQLQRVGVHSVKALLALPIEELAGRFSQDIIKYLYAIKGLSNLGRVFYQPKTFFTECIELPFEMENQEHLLRWASALLDLLQSYLRSRNQATQEITFTFIDSEKCSYPLVLQASLAQYLSHDWAAILALKLEKTTFSNPIRSIQLECHNSLNISPSSNDFFSSQRTHAIDVHKLFDTLSTRLENNAFHPPNSQFFTLSEHWPADAATPAFMLTKPTRLESKGRIVAGPQRLQTQWWCTPLKRDYFLLETPQAERLWVYRNTPVNSTYPTWFFQGWFS